MFTNCVLSLALVVTLTFVSAGSVSQSDGVYTDLSSSKCKTIEVDKETGSTVQRCPGIAGYQLLVLNDDARQSITVIAPDAKKHPLEYWEVITPAFSTLGDKAEWRVEKKNGRVVPVALIVRVNTNPDSFSSEKKASYLAVAKITPRRICVTARIVPGATANEEARRAAASSAGKPCLKD